MSKHKSAFTLIEILASLALLGVAIILITMVIVPIARVKEQAYETETLLEASEALQKWTNEGTPDSYKLYWCRGELTQQEPEQGVWITINKDAQGKQINLGMLGKQGGLSYYLYE